MAEHLSGPAVTFPCLRQEESQRPLVAVVHALTSLLGSMCFPSCSMSLKTLWRARMTTQQRQWRCCCPVCPPVGQESSWWTHSSRQDGGLGSTQHFFSHVVQMTMRAAVPTNQQPPGSGAPPNQVAQSGQAPPQGPILRLPNPGANPQLRSLLLSQQQPVRGRGLLGGVESVGSRLGG